MKNRLQFYFGLACAGLLFALGSRPAQAQLSQFAAALTGANGLQFTNSGAGSALTTNPTPRNLPSFLYTIATGTGLDAFTPIPAQMVLTSNVGAAGGFSQVLSTVTMAITARPGTVNDGINSFTFNGGENLITMTATNSILSTTSGSTNGQVAGDTSLALQTITYTSAYLNFTTTVQRTFNWILNPMNASATVNANSYLNSFTTTGNLSFSSDPAPISSSSAPEPGTILLLMLGGLGLARRRRH